MPQKQQIGLSVPSVPPHFPLRHPIEPCPEVQFSLFIRRAQSRYSHAVHKDSVNTAKFEADRYLRSRPLYPAAIYESLVKNLSSRGTFLDLGCGTGQSTLSFASLGLADRGIAIDRDPEMIRTARAAARPNALKDFPIDYQVAPAESLPLEDQSVDVVLVGSAIHWFEIEGAKREIENVLKPGGSLFVYEYQFPKAEAAPELNEFIRRKFNTEWKAPTQVPRGTLADLVAPFTRDSTRWKNGEESRPVWNELLTLESFLGNLFSQSRYLHAEAARADPAKYQMEIATEVAPYFAAGPLVFDFKPRAFRFVLRWDQ